MKKDDDRVELRVPRTDLVRWRVTAGLDGVVLSEWIRRVCNGASIDQATFADMKKAATDKRASVARAKEAVRS